MFTKNLKITLILTILFFGTMTHRLEAQIAANNTTVAIETDLKNWVSRCYNCIPMKDAAKKYTASSHIGVGTLPRKTELFTLEVHGDKYAFKADNGQYLKTCYSCSSAGLTIISVEPLSSGKVTGANLFTITPLSNGNFTIQSGNGTYWTRYKPAPGAKNIIASYKKDYALGAAQFSIKMYEQKTFEETKRVFTNFKNSSAWDFRFRYVYQAYENGSQKKSAWTVVQAGQNATNVGSDQSPANVSGDYYKVNTVEIQWKRVFEWVDYTGPTPIVTDPFKISYTASGQVPGTPSIR